MSDITPGGDAPAADAAPAGAPAPTAPAPAAADDLGKFGEHGAYIKELRAEAAKYRTANKPYEEAFGAYSDEDRAVWTDLAKMMQSDPIKAAAEMSRIGGALTEQLTPKQQAAVDKKDAEAETGEKGMTRAEVEQFISDRDASQAQERAVNDITAKVATKFPAGTAEHREVLFLAANETGGDIDKAFAKMEERKQAVIDGWLTGKKSKADGPRPVSTQGAATGTAQPIRNLKDSRAALEARLAAQQA